MDTKSIFKTIRNFFTTKQKDKDEYQEFLCDYTFNGETYCVSIFAKSWEEAEQRLRCISCNGKIVGSNVFTVNIPFT